MPVRAVLGLQWGDEGKGKIVDVLSEWAEVVVRAQGGANAGHTVVVGGRQSILHLLPSGILRPNVHCVIGHGVIVDPAQMLAEIDEVRAAGSRVDPGNLSISERAHVVMPYHMALDAARETARGATGTTRRGIGPCYADKHQYRGFRFCDLANEARFGEKLRELVPEKNALLAYYGHAPLDADAVFAHYRAFHARLAPYVTDTYRLVRRAIRERRRVLLEGAQGSMLDLDYGTYPFVTGSNTCLDGVITGCGVPHTDLESVIGIVKAYTTRVGRGPFPTRLDGALGRTLRERGREYGATTGRPRDCGWLDGVLLRYAIELSGVTELMIMKLDVLSGLDEVALAVEYHDGGVAVSVPPADADRLAAVTVAYERLPGWAEDLSACRRWEDLPDAARAYLEAVETRLARPISVVSVGPEREQIIHRAPPPFRA